VVFNPRLWRTATAAAVCQSANLGGFRGGDWATDVEHCVPHLVFTDSFIVNLLKLFVYTINFRVH
jgi:hypothetical protein